jgi:hypothetical protein
MPKQYQVIASGQNGHFPIAGEFPELLIKCPIFKSVIEARLQTLSLKFVSFKEVSKHTESSLTEV